MRQLRPSAISTVSVLAAPRRGIAALFIGLVVAVFSALAACVASLALVTNAAAQTPSFKCAELLTAEQVKSIAGPGMAQARPQQREVGESECVWRRGSGAAAVSLAVRFFDRQAVNANPVSRTLEGYYQMLVNAGEEAAERKREAIVGVPRAALIQASPQILVLVQRSDGVARVVLGNLGRAQAVAVAKLIAAQ